MPKASVRNIEKSHAMCRTVVRVIVRDMRARRKQLRAFITKHEKSRHFDQHVAFVQGAAHELDHYINIVESALQHMK